MNQLKWLIHPSFWRLVWKIIRCLVDFESSNVQWRVTNSPYESMKSLCQKIPGAPIQTDHFFMLKHIQNRSILTKTPCRIYIIGQLFNSYYVSKNISNWLYCPPSSRFNWYNFIQENAFCLILFGCALAFMLLLYEAFCTFSFTLCLIFNRCHTETRANQMNKR